MEKHDQSYDEVDVGDSCPPFSEGDFEDILSEEMDGKKTIPSPTQTEYERLRTMVVPDSEDEGEASIPYVRSRRRLDFVEKNEKNSDACTPPIDPVAKSESDDDDYSVAGVYEKWLGVFCPTFKDLTPRRRKKYFPKK